MSTLELVITGQPVLVGVNINTLSRKRVKVLVSQLLADDSLYRTCLDVDTLRYLQNPDSVRQGLKRVQRVESGWVNEGFFNPLMPEATEAKNKLEMLLADGHVSPERMARITQLLNNFAACRHSQDRMVGWLRKVQTVLDRSEGKPYIGPAITPRQPTDWAAIAERDERISPRRPASPPPPDKGNNRRNRNGSK